MASRPEPSLLSNGERGVQHSQADYINVDIKILQNTDYGQPFTSLEDAAQQLFPFHLLAAQDDNEADLDETEDHEGAGLLASRQEAWSHWLHTRLAEARRKGEALEQRVHQLYKEVHAPTPTPSALDRYQVELMQRDKAAQDFQTLQARCRPLQPPPQPPMLSHTAAAAAAAAAGVPAMLRAGTLPVHGVRPPMGAPMGAAMQVLHHPHPGPHGWPGVTSPRGLGLPPGPLPPPPMAAVGPGGMGHQPGMVPPMRLPGGPLPGGVGVGHVRPHLPAHLLHHGAMAMGMGALPLQQQQLLLPLQQHQQQQHQQQQHQQHQRPQ